MSQSITVELKFFAISILWGVLVLLAYDQLRILRRIIRHNIFWVTFEDLIFWVVASIFIFAMIYVENSGIIRGFSVMGMTVGMVMYHFLLSDLIVKFVSRGILFLLYPFSVVLKYLKKGLKFLFNKAKKLINRIYMQLKKTVKSVKIIISKNKKISSERHNNKKSKKSRNRKSKKINPEKSKKTAHKSSLR